MNVLKYAYEHGLHQVVRIVVVNHHSTNEAIHTLLLLLHELPESEVTTTFVAKLFY